MTETLLANITGDGGTPIPPPVPISSPILSPVPTSPPAPTVPAADGLGIDKVMMEI